MTKEIIVIGSGMAGLTAACLLAKEGNRIRLIEQNWLPGGCSSSYPRKHYIFESGATTLVGLDDHMPLKYLLEETGIQLHPTILDVPMRVYLKDGSVLTRHHDLDQWIAEAERVFGPRGQREFWEYCFGISQFVWETSLKQRVFPPSRLIDLWHAARNFRPRQLSFATLAYQSMDKLLRKHGLRDNPLFVDFVNEQLLITAQNQLEEVNVLFGATALCYTNYTNYYMPGGLLQMVDPLLLYIERQGGEVQLRETVKQVVPVNGHYEVHTDKGTYQADAVVSSIPINNTLPLFENANLSSRLERKTMRSAQLNSAFSLGFVAKRHLDFDCLHHQVHLKRPLPQTESASIFLSVSHPEDSLRCGPDEFVGSVSTHVHDPANRPITDKEAVVNAIYEALEEQGLLKRENLIFEHASTPGAWQKWTAREWGFVGGYPQYMSIKPWQMLDARLDGKKAYICGDSTYPGQGIPGACLSGIIAVEKMKVDGVV
ncbi:MAG: NAD(P)/FAD-dependent oxidoreductase [Bacteroidota bacterium]